MIGKNMEMSGDRLSSVDPRRLLPNVEGRKRYILAAK